MLRVKSRGLCRYRCKSCGRTFGPLTSTAFRWRHRFLAAVRQSPDRLAGIVEADETFALESRKGEQVPILVAADRGGGTLSRTLPKLDADSVKRALAPVIAPDALLVSDAGHCHRRGVRHPRKSVTRSAGERVRGAVHIQTATSRHSQIKGFLRRSRGIATKCLDSYLRWFHLVVLGRHPSPRACLAAASVRTCLRFAN